MTDIRLQLPHFTASLYLAPISDKGWITVWKGKHSSWRHGFVVRVLWLGIVVRWGYVKKLMYRDIETDYIFALCDEAPH